MTIFGYISAKFDSGCIVKLLTETGELYAAFELRNYSKAREVAQKFAKENYLEWLDRPWQNDHFLMAKRQYENKWNCDFNGKVLN